MSDMLIYKYRPFYRENRNCSSNSSHHTSAQIWVKVKPYIGREPWSGGYGRRLTYQRSWVWILALYTGWTWHFFTFICCKNCLFEKTEKEAGPPSSCLPGRVHKHWWPHNSQFLGWDGWNVKVFRSQAYKVPDVTNNCVEFPVLKTLNASVTRFGEISQLGQNLKSLWLFFMGLFCIWQNVEPNWEFFMILDKFSFLLMAQYWKDNLTIWSRCLNAKTRHPDG